MCSGEEGAALVAAGCPDEQVSGQLPRWNRDTSQRNVGRPIPSARGLYLPPAQRPRRARWDTDRPCRITLEEGGVASMTVRFRGKQFHSRESMRAASSITVRGSAQLFLNLQSLQCSGHTRGSRPTSRAPSWCLRPCPTVPGSVFVQRSGRLLEDWRPRPSGRQLAIAEPEQPRDMAPVSRAGRQTVASWGAPLSCDAGTRSSPPAPAHTSSFPSRLRPTC